MKIKSKKRFTPLKLLITVAILVVLLGSAAFALFINNNSETKNTYDTSQGGQRQDNKNDDTSLPDGTLPSKSATDSANEQPYQSDTDAPTATPETPTIDRSSQSGTSVKVVATFQKSSSGYCELRFQKLNQPSVTAKSDIVVSPSYYSCSFVIPLSEFSTDGAWDATVIHRVGSGVANSDTVPVSVSK